MSRRIRIEGLADRFDFDHGCFSTIEDARMCRNLLRDPLAFVEKPAGYNQMAREEQAAQTEFRVWLKEQDRYFWPVGKEEMVGELWSVGRSRYG
jgi:hypothetical protein